MKKPLNRKVRRNARSQGSVGDQADSVSPKNASIRSIPGPSMASRRTTRASAAAASAALSAAVAAAAPAPAAGGQSSTDTHVRTRSQASAAAQNPSNITSSGSSTISHNAVNGSSKAFRHTDIKGSDSSSSTKLVTCNICLEDVSTAAMRRLGCRHSFCKDCLLSHLKSRLKAKQLPATCPAHGCKRQVGQKFARLILAATPRLRNKFLEASREAIAISQGKAIYCPHTSCSKLVPIKKLSTVAAKGLTKVQQQHKQQEAARQVCKHCHCACCTSCHVSWHAGLTCTQYQALPASEKGADDLALWKLSEDQRWKRCPSCRSIVERTEGCNYMMCRCGKPFCYACGAEIDTCYKSGCIAGRTTLGWY